MEWFWQVWVAAVVHLASGTGMSALHDTSSENRVSSAAQYCTDLNPQTGLDIEQIMGIWFGSEVITHLGNEDGESIYDTCVVIHLSDITNSTAASESPYRDQGPEVRFGTSYGYPGDRSQQQHNSDGNRRYQNQQYHNRQQHTSSRFLKLLWDEKDHTLEYTLRFNNSRPGFWISSAPQSGSMIQLPYIQFTGTVQVLKAINNQLVLTFCQSLPGGQLFSIVLSRQAMGLSLEENQSIRNLLKRRNLSTTSVRKVCYNGAADRALFGTALVLTAALLFRSKLKF